MAVLIHNAVTLSKALIGQMAGQVRVAADLTAGNGHDTAYILDTFPELRRIYAMDVQAEALDQCRRRFLDHPKAVALQLIQDGHENIDRHVPEGTTLDLVLYNLGYLPGQGKHITTMMATTLCSVQKSLDLLTPKGGLLSIVCYPGHEEGHRELRELQPLLASLDQKQFNIIQSQFVNQVNNPPVSILIQKR